MLIAAAFIVAQAVAGPCAHDRSALLAMPPDRFDGTEITSWRTLSRDPACLEIAADLLRDYREANQVRLDVSQLHLNYWHEGQIRAGLGQKQRAVHLLMAGVNPEVSTDGFADYALGTVAFVNGDRAALLAARDRLAATPQPPDWEKAAEEYRQQFGREIAWPMNLNVLDGLIACFDRPYLEAYGSADCRP